MDKQHSGYEEEMRGILERFLQKDNSLRHLVPYIVWVPGSVMITLDGSFTPDELQAIAWWVRHIHLAKVTEWFKVCEEAATYYGMSACEFIDMAIKDRLP